MNNAQTAFEQQEGETCIECDTPIHEVPALDMNGNPTGETYLACHGTCIVMTRGGRVSN